MSDCCPTPKKRPSYLLWGSISTVFLAYAAQLFYSGRLEKIQYLGTFIESNYDLLNKMSWGLLLGILFVGILDRIPQDAVQKVMGKGGTVSGILRATLAGILLDLCSHGILLVGMKLYKQGLSLGQTMAFLIASPWNSLSLTLILWALVGFKWMLAFLLLSMAIAIISGIIFDRLVKKGVLQENPATIKDPKEYSIFSELKKNISLKWLSPSSISQTLATGLKGSKMIIKWIFFGIILASLVRTFIPPENFQTLFGPTLSGLGLTLLVATILEVCSEGSTPIAADILTRAGAPGNSFAFLMTGVSTDYTEILSIKETTNSWKTALFLPLITLPQVIAIALIINFY